MISNTSFGQQQLKLSKLHIGLNVQQGQFLFQTIKCFINMDTIMFGFLFYIALLLYYHIIIDLAQ